jgi:hypothetical protein
VTSKKARPAPPWRGGRERHASAALARLAREGASHRSGASVECGSARFGRDCWLSEQQDDSAPAVHRSTAQRPQQSIRSVLSWAWPAAAAAAPSSEQRRAGALRGTAQGAAPAMFFTMIES